jgi:hypothetical protein
MHVRHDVMAIDQDVRVAWSAQSHVQHSALFGDIDLLAAEHRIAAFRHAAFLCQPQEKPHCLIRDAVL